MDELRKIKKLLPELTSADLELVITDCVRRLRLESYREAERVIRLSLDPKTIELLKVELADIEGGGE